MSRDDLLTGGHRDAAPPDVDLDRVWLGVAERVWRRRPGPVERAARRLLRSPGLARALVTTPSLLLGWVIASAVILLAGVGMTLGTGAPWVALLAPVVAASGIAYAYGPGVDPAWELSQSMAVGGRYIAAVTDSALVLPYLAFAACCGVVIFVATRIPRGTR